MARRNQARPKPMILQKGDAGIRIILDSSALIPLCQRGIFARASTTQSPRERGEGQGDTKFIKHSFAATPTFSTSPRSLCGARRSAC